MKEGTLLDSTDIKTTKWEIMNKNMPTVDNLDEIDKFLHRHKLQSSPTKNKSPKDFSKRIQINS